jgi:FRG domain
MGPRQLISRPASWLELLDLLLAGSWNPSLGRFRSPYAFRGHARADEDLSSGLLRLAAGRPDVARLELHLLRNFRKYAYGEAEGGSIWQWLAVAQHRGLPTRLLDWTYSPFVALHFATANLARMNEDASVWAINFVEANRHLPARLRRMLATEGSDTATVDMLAPFGTLTAFDRLSKRPFVVFLEPPSLDPRIVNQFALFSLMSNPSATLDGWLASHPELVRRIIIPASLKWEIRDNLDQANINERVLFPGLDGLSRWLTRYYWAKPSSAPPTNPARTPARPRPRTPRRRKR